MCNHIALTLLTLSAIGHCRKLLQAVVPSTHGLQEKQFATVLELPPPHRPLNVIYSSDTICADQQSINQPPSSEELILRFNLDELPAHGFVYIYGTNQPVAQEKILEVHNPYHVEASWNTIGTGGNGHGRLLGRFPLSDSACQEKNTTISIPANETHSSLLPDLQYQNSSSQSQMELGRWWCMNKLFLPNDINSGTVSLYWILDLSVPPSEGSPAYLKLFTSCLDLQIRQAANLMQRDADPQVFVRETSTMTLTVSFTLQCTATAYTNTVTATTTVTAPAAPLTITRTIVTTVTQKPPPTDAEQNEAKIQQTQMPLYLIGSTTLPPRAADTSV